MVTAKEVPPGGAGEIKTVFRSKGYNGPVKKTFTVLTNDPKNKQVRLKLKGKVTSEVTAEPRYLNFGNVKKDQPPSPLQLKIGFREGKQLHIKEVYSDSKAIVLTKKEENETGAIYSVSLAERLKLGRHLGKIIIKTNSSKAPKVQVSFYAVVQGNVKVSPQALFFGSVQPGKPATRILTLTKTGEKTFSIEKVKTIKKEISTEIVMEKEGERYKIRSIYDPGDKTTGKISDTMTIFIKAGDEEEVLALPVSGAIKERKKSHPDRDRRTK